MKKNFKESNDGAADGLGFQVCDLVEQTLDCMYPLIIELSKAMKQIAPHTTVLSCTHLEVGGDILKEFMYCNCHKHTPLSCNSDNSLHWEEQKASGCNHTGRDRARLTLQSLLITKHIITHPIQMSLIPIIFYSIESMLDYMYSGVDSPWLARQLVCCSQLARPFLPTLVDPQRR